MVFETKKGANPDVVLFPTELVIASRYPDLPAEETILGSNSYFFDYFGAIEKERKLLSMQLYGDEGFESDFEPDGEMSKQILEEYTSVVSEFGSERAFISIPNDMYWKFHKHILIGDAWGFVLSEYNYKPDITVLPDIWYALTRSPNQIYDDTSKRIRYQMQHVMGEGREYREKHAIENGLIPGDDGLSEKLMDKRHPLSHFPPSSLLEKSLNEKIFYDPSNPGKYMGDIQSGYGSAWTTIYSYLARAKKIVRYSDIIKPLGQWGFRIDWRYIGMSTTFDVPLDDMLFGLGYLDVKSYHVRNFNNNGESWELRRVKESVYENIEYYAATAWDKRDNWVQFWLAGGYIPLSPNSIVDFYAGKPSGLRRISPSSRYDFRIARKPTEVDWDAVGTFVTAIIGSLVSFYAYGGLAALSTSISMIMEYIEPVVEDLFGGLPDGIDVITTSVFSALLGEAKRMGFPDESARSKVADSVIKLSEVSVAGSAASWSSSSEREAIKNLIDKIDMSVEERHKMILDSLLRAFDANTGEKINSILGGRVYAAGDNIILADERGRIAAQAKRGGLKLLPGHIREGKSGLAKIGAIGLGLAVLYKLWEKR